MVTYTFTDGTLIKSSEMNTNFTDLQDDVDINISDISDNTDDISTNTTNIGINKNAFVLSAQNYFETLKHSGDVDNTDYLIADIFTSNVGVKSSINTGASSCDFVEAASDSFNNSIYSISPTYTAMSGTTYQSGATNPEYAFDNNDTTKADVTGYLGKTFTEKYVSIVRLFIGRSGGGGIYKLQYYNGSSWIDTSTELSPSTISSEKIYPIGLNVQGIRVLCISGYIFVNSLEEAGSFASLEDVETNNLIALDGTEKGIVVYDKSNKPTGTSIKVDVVGSSTISNQNVREYIDISSFTGGNLSLDFNLSTTNTSVTPSLYGYGIAIIK